MFGSAKKPRIEAKALKGVTGDPWAPVLSDGTKSWGVSAAGFGYWQMTTLLDPSEVRLPPLALAHVSDGGSGLTLHAAAVTRGQGKTEGFHERAIPIPPKAASLFQRIGGGIDRVADVAKERREAAGNAQDILRHALRALHQGGPDTVRHDNKETNDRIRRWERLLDMAIDARFFDEGFWDEVTAEGPQEDARDLFGRRWREALRVEARRVLDEAVKAAPRTTMRRHRAIVRARSIFDGRMAVFVEPDAEKRAAQRAKRGEDAHA